MGFIGDKNFIILENGLYCCKECNGTYENESECLEHLKELNHNIKKEGLKENGI